MEILPPRLPALLLTLALLTVGCSSLAAPGTTATPQASVTPVEPPDATDTPTTEQSPETTRCHCMSNGRFEIHEGYDGPVTVLIRDAGGPNATVVANQTFTERFTVHDFDPVMAYGVDYQVVIRVDGEAVWTETISRSEGYEVRVHENGTASVMSHAIV